MKKEITIQISNEVILRGYVFEPNCDSKGVIQICHGMAEHIERYFEFMEYLSNNGYTVVGYDQRGHGKTAGCLENCGYMDDSNNIEVLISDVNRVNDYIREYYPDQKIFLFGHSMGSFISQRFVELYNGKIHGLILSGSSYNNTLIIKMGHSLSSLITKIKGRRHVSKLIHNLSLGSYNNKFKPNKTTVDWLSRSNENNVKYENDEYCGMMFSVSYYKDLTETFSLIAKEIELIDNDLPIFIISGDNDPVGNFGKGVITLFNKLKSVGIIDLTLKLYKEGRHEMLNELNKQEVFKDVLKWIEKH